jgi:hypothetical protein
MSISPWLLVIAITTTSAAYSAEKSSNAAVAVIRQHCWKCHGEAKASQLDLRTRDGMLRGGAHGVAIVPGHPEQSRLYRRMEGLETPAMPLDGKLTQAEVTAVREWIVAGAPWDEKIEAPSTVAYSIDHLIPPAAFRYWAFVTPKRITPPRLTKNPIDAFLLKAMKAKGLKAAPLADFRTLARRAYLDLVGLPPTPEEVNEFVNDKAPHAWERLVDRLLESPHYGERWGRHWLDVARYADSDGFEYDFNRPNAWRYRDWVVSAFNQDMPYDEFIREQIAGDEIEHVTNESLTATGFMRMYPKVGYREKANPQYRLDYLDDLIATIGKGLLGLTVQCARCHDHKFDPIPQTDYYRLQASLFGYVEVDHPLVSLEDTRVYEERKKQTDDQIQALNKRLDEVTKPYSDAVLVKSFQAYPAYIRAALDTPESKRTPGQALLATQVQKTTFASSKDVEAIMPPWDLDERRRILADLKHLYEAQPVAPPSAMGITDGDYLCAPEGPGDEDAPGKGDVRAGSCSFLFSGAGRYSAPESHLLYRGDRNNPGPTMRPGFVTVASRWSPPVELPPTTGKTSGRRRALAEWIVSRENPLTARVEVNRIWQHHFGRGLAPTLDNFGKMGEPPSDPELLDWLAVEFMDHGWSIKYMHRLIMTSEAYRRASRSTDSKSNRVDPEDINLWRYRPQRLEAEALRDAILTVSGGLDPSIGGPPVFPELPEEILGSMRYGTWEKHKDDPAVWRRSIYVYRKRGLPFPMFDAFDLPDQNFTCSRRNISTVPTQALILLNDKFVLDQAKLFAERVSAKESDPTRQIDLAYEIALSRSPKPEERLLALRFLQQHPLEEFAHVVLNLNEFIYR